MPKGGKLSYDSLEECLGTSETESDVGACQKYFAEKDMEVPIKTTSEKIRDYKGTVGGERGY